jgi:hypothetical protein
MEKEVSVLKVANRQLEKALARMDLEENIKSINGIYTSENGQWRS